MSKFNKQDLINKLMGTFLDELDEHVITLNENLLGLEKLDGGSVEYKDSIRSLFRAAHSLKGAARSVDVGVVEKVCHQLEDLLDRLKDSDLTPDKQVFHLLFRAADVLGKTGKRLRENKNTDQSEIYDLLAKLSSITLIASSEADTEIDEWRADEPKVVGPVVYEPIAHSYTAFGQLEAEPPAFKCEQTLPSLAPKIENAVIPTRQTESCQSVRVSSDRLDKLLALSSEFLTSYRRTETWQSAVDEIADGLHDCFSYWQPIEKQLHQMLECGLEANRQESIDFDQSRHKRISNSAGQRLLNAPSSNTKILSQLVKDIDRFLAVMKREVRAIGETARLVDEEIRGLRMLPFNDACMGLQLAVRELVNSTGKEVELDIKGGDVELDRSVLESLKDPLLHIVRNAVQHGIEPPGTRLDSGKPRLARIELSASLCGAHVQILIKDDGRGIDEQAVREQARLNGMPEPQTPEEVAGTIFLPWFSTSKDVNTVSGRGVGLDVVANQISSLQGTVTVSYDAYKGTCFTLTVPLTLTKIRVLLVKVCGQTFAFPSTTVKRLLRITAQEMRSIKGSLVLPIEGQLVPVASLSDTLKLGSEPNAHESNRKIPAVVLSHGNCHRAFIIDELVDEQEVVVTTLGARLQSLKGVSGATLLATGEIALILNSSELLKKNNVQAVTRKVETGEQTRKSKRLIVADDSPTTRILETSILQAAGYDVRAVSDGQDAWELLEAEGADLIVSDVEMPIMNGFELTRTIRGSERWNNLPIILVTGLGKDIHREQGLKAGASAYVVKSEFDQSELIQTIEQLI